MAKEAEKEQGKYCPSCGKPYTDLNRYGASDMWSAGKKDIFCLNCQERKFNQVLAATDDELIAFYFNCLYFNRPFDVSAAKEIIAEPLKQGHWVGYLKRLREKKLLTEGRKYRDFRDADTGLDPRLVNIIGESERYERKASSSGHGGRWGVKFVGADEAVPYTPMEIKELDSMYAEQAAEYKGSITQRVDMAIREICVCRMEWKKCVGVGDAAGAKKYSDMIKDVMARESLRANDAKPTETMRIDSLIDRLERKGAMVDGSLVGRKQLLEILAADHPQYRTSLDVVDAMMMAIVNTMRRNSGQSELDTLPITAQITDDFGELMSEPTEQEKRAMEDIGVVRPVRDRPIDESDMPF